MMIIWISGTKIKNQPCGIRLEKQKSINRNSFILALALETLSTQPHEHTHTFVDTQPDGWMDGTFLVEEKIRFTAVDLLWMSLTTTGVDLSHSLSFFEEKEKKKGERESEKVCQSEKNDRKSKRDEQIQ